MFNNCLIYYNAICKTSHQSISYAHYNHVFSGGAMRISFKGELRKILTHTILKSCITTDGDVFSYQGTFWLFFYLTNSKYDLSRRFSARKIKKVKNCTDVPEGL